MIFRAITGHLWMQDFVQVETAAHVGCVRYGMNYVKDGSSFEFYYTPEKETYIQSITLESESLGRRTFLVNDNNIVWAETGGQALILGYTRSNDQV